MHTWKPNNVNSYVIRFALWVSLTVALGPLSGAEIDQKALLKGIEQRYNRTKTLKVQFTESYSVQGKPRKSESGELTLRKPGRMRWDYTAPPGKLFLSDGKDVYLYTPDTNRVEKTKLKASDDMRAPLAFLLGKLDFSKEFRDFDVKAAGANFLVSARAKNDSLPYEKIEMVVTADYQIERLVVNSQDKSILTFRFTDERLNMPVDDALFKFQMPAGATLVSEGDD